MRKKGKILLRTVFGEHTIHLEISGPCNLISDNQTYLVNIGISCGSYVLQVNTKYVESEL